MGRVAGERCRLVVVTDEDPRGEPREVILEQIAEGAEAAGLHRGSELRLVPDRRAAIALALEAARPGDAVLFAGKGHEKTIETAEGAVPWDEAAEVRAALARLGWSGSGPLSGAAGERRQLDPRRRERPPDLGRLRGRASGGRSAAVLGLG